MPNACSHLDILWRLRRSWSLATPQDFRTPVPLGVALAVAPCSSLSLANTLGSSAFAALCAVLSDSPTAWCAIAPRHAGWDHWHATVHRLQQPVTPAFRRRRRWISERTLDKTYKKEHSARSRCACPKTTQAESISSPNSHRFSLQNTAFPMCHRLRQGRVGGDTAVQPPRTYCTESQALRALLINPLHWES